MTGFRNLCLPGLLAPLILLTAGGCSSESKTPARVRQAPTADLTDRTEDVSWSAPFIDVAREAGVVFEVETGRDAQLYTILESIGAGGAIADVDLDGRLDVICVGSGNITPPETLTPQPGAVFRSRGQWKYDDATVLSHIQPPAFYSNGICCGDLDDDGFVDLIVTGYRGCQVHWNCGDGTFDSNALKLPQVEQSWLTSAATGDLNGDGWVDLYAAAYVDWSFEKNPSCRNASGEHSDVCPPGLFDALPDLRLLSDGQGGWRLAGKSPEDSQPGKGLGVLIGDLDTDRDLDVYVANDATPNFLLRNDGSGELVEAGLASGAALSQRFEADGSMGVDLGDFNNDGRPDLWVTNYESQHFAMYRNDGDCLFHHVSTSTGLARSGGLFVGFGTRFSDLDLDGDLDLLSTNGHVLYSSPNVPLEQQPLLFKNNGRGEFDRVTSNAGKYFQESHVGRGLATGDLDRDGDPDVLITHSRQPVALLKNELTTHRHWLNVRLVATATPRESVGAKMICRSGDRVTTRWIHSGGSYLSASPYERIIAIAEGATIESLEVIWPSGRSDTFVDIPIDASIVIIEGIGVRQLPATDG